VAGTGSQLFEGEVFDGAMTRWLNLLTVFLLLPLSACVSAGARAITDAGMVSMIEVDKSTQADVAALLGYPLATSRGDQGEETWHYTWVTAIPTPAAFVPVVKAVIPSLHETPRELAVTFNRDGIVKSLDRGRVPPRPRPAG